MGISLTTKVSFSLRFVMMMQSGIVKYTLLKADDWSKIEEVAIQNSDDYTNTHPFLATVNGGEQVLYFVSDRNGGKGATDIWSAARTGKNSYSTPAPLVCDQYHRK
jgi:hypothetical protein